MKKVSTRNADIKITMSSSLPANIPGQGDFPKNGNPGSIVLLNPKFSGSDFAKKKYTLIHELGHFLGFRHTDWAKRKADGRNKGDGIDIAGTSNDDEFSIMNSVLYSLLNGFSKSDVIAAQWLYTEDTNVEYVQLIGGAFITSSNKGRVNFKVANFNYDGNVFISVTAKNKDGNIKIKNSISIPVKGTGGENTSGGGSGFGEI